jgi:hypothetical protein
VKKRKTKRVSRFQYRVTLTCEDGSEPEFTVWAETPEHAIRKVVKEKHGSPLIILGKKAERIKS